MPLRLRSEPTIEPTSSTDAGAISAAGNFSCRSLVTYAPTSLFSTLEPFSVSAVSPVLTSRVVEPTPSWYWMIAALSKSLIAARTSATAGFASLLRL